MKMLGLIVIAREQGIRTLQPAFQYIASRITQHEMEELRKEVWMLKLRDSDDLDAIYQRILSRGVTIG